MSNQTYTHVLQQSGILKNFSVAKIVKKNDIDELKKLIKTVAVSDDEYNQLLKEELDKLSDMHDANNPIPGIIYPSGGAKLDKKIIGISEKFCQSIKSQKFDTRQLAMLITAIIHNLKLTQQDFLKLNEEFDNGEDSDED